jgi:hypothetical protein
LKSKTIHPEMKTTPSRFGVFHALGVLGFACFFMPNASALVSSYGGTSVFNGVYINEVIGADVFYNQGFGGQRAVIANIEAGTIWGGHETMQGRTIQNLFDPTITGTQLGQADWHATFVGQALAGRGLYTHQDGIAPLAQLWSGSIATSWSGAPLEQFVGSFDTTEASFLYPYRTAMVTGVNGTRADVINSSWGYTDPTGSSAEAVAIDAMLRSSGVIGVFSAGNSGPDGNTVGAPGSGYNGITVGALTNSAALPTYDTIADFSSRGWNDAYNPQTDVVISNARAKVDLVAPGDNLTMAFYGGLTGGHIAGSDPTAGSGQYYISGMSGTSFSAPIVAGAAALMVDAGKAFGISEMVHPLVVKAALMAGATPTQGWNNGQYLDGAVIRTSQALDLAAGAGALNLEKTHSIYIGGSLLLAPSVYATDGKNTLGVSGLSGASHLAAQGWDLGAIQGGANMYTLAGVMAAGSQFSAVLTWYAARGFDVALTSAQDTALSNLSLELWCLDQNLGDRLVGRSESPWGTTEHLRFTLSETGRYQIRVVWENQNYQMAAEPNLLTDYGLAWSFAPIPEPSVAVMLGLSFLFWTNRRHRRVIAR